MRQDPPPNPPRGVGRLIPALPAGTYVTEPPEIDRLLVRLMPDGTLAFRGPRPLIEEFLRRCAAAGVEVRVDYIALCG